MAGPPNLYIVLLTAQLLQEKLHVVSNSLLYKAQIFSVSRAVDSTQGSRSTYTETFCEGCMQSEKAGNEKRARSRADTKH